MALRPMTKFIRGHRKWETEEPGTDLVLRPQSLSVRARLHSETAEAPKHSSSYKMTRTLPDRIWGDFYVFYKNSKKLAIVHKTFTLLFQTLVKS